MRVAIPKYNAIETLLFIVILFTMVFNNGKYGTVFAKVSIPILLFVFYSSMKQNILKHPKTNLVMGLLWCLGFVISSLASYGNNFVDIMALAVICIFIFWCCLFLEIKFDRTQIRLIFNIYVFCTFIISSNIIINYLTGNFYREKRASYEIFDVYKDPNYVAALIVPAMFIVLVDMFNKNKVKDKIMLILLNAVFITAFIMTSSRGSFVAIIASIGVYTILQLIDSRIKFLNKVLIILGIIVSTIFISVFLLYSTSRLTDFSSYSADVRIHIWKNAFDFWKKSPLIGNGAGSTSNYTLIGIYSLATHNCFMDLLGDSGILGIFCFLCILRNIIKSAGNKKKTISFIVLCFVPLMFINGFYTLNFWIVLCLSKLYSEYTILEKQNQELTSYT